MSIGAIILAAGRGVRAQFAFGSKQYYPLQGKPILYHSLLPFLEHEAINPLIIVIHEDEHALCEAVLKALPDHEKTIHIVTGGETRQDSAYKGLIDLKAFECAYVHIHDAARPFVTKEDLTLLHEHIHPNQGAILAQKVSDSLKKADNNLFIEKTVERTHLFYAQTPQIFPFSIVLNAHQAAKEANKLFTDDASIAEFYGLPIKIVTHSTDNFKVTWPTDFKRAEFMLNQKENYPDIRVGNGYDIHSFISRQTGKPSFITLCNVKIPYPKLLNGHSDSDVALHALTDALLAVNGEGDIGTHFPPNETKWKNADSTIFLNFANEKILEKKAKINNIDITIIAEAPKISPYRAEMVRKLSEILNLNPARISIKATTNEKLGALGRAEGIAALATSAVFFPSAI